MIKVSDEYLFPNAVVIDFSKALKKQTSKYWWKSEASRILTVGIIVWVILSEKKSMVNVEKVYSDFRDHTHEVPQESIFGNILFLLHEMTRSRQQMQWYMSNMAHLYVNDIENHLHSFFIRTSKILSKMHHWLKFLLIFHYWYMPQYHLQ